jgi:hypothetical protein
VNRRAAESKFGWCGITLATARDRLPGVDQGHFQDGRSMVIAITIIIVIVVFIVVNG